MTQEIWEKLVEFARRLGSHEPEDLVQTCLTEDLARNGAITGYTTWLIVKRRMNVIRTFVSLEEANKVEAESDEVKQEIANLLHLMEKRKDFDHRDVSVFVLRSVGHTYREIAPMFGLSAMRIRQIHEKTLSKLRGLHEGKEGV